MTDDEIITALECCDFTDIKACEECPLYHTFDCSFVIIDKSLDLIARQKAEIERLKKDFDIMCFVTAKRWVKNAKSEAIKEFAEELKNCFTISGDYLDIINIINNLIKEMTEIKE